MGLLSALGKGQGYLKAGFLGFNKSGKTFTAARLAIGTRQHFGLTGPIAMYDTEGGSEYIAPMIQKATGMELVGTRSRSLQDLIDMAKECEKDGISVLIADSMTHPWREICETYMAEVNKRRARKNPPLPPRTKLEFQDWGNIKAIWAPWTDFYINSRLHIIVCGRAGDIYEYEDNEETGKKDLIKSGVKMKTETEFGFEPSLLVEMERHQGRRGEDGEPLLLHRATVIGDRFGVIDGHTADDPTFEFFEPHLKLLKSGAHAPVNTERKTEMHGADDSGDMDWAQEKRSRAILCEEVQGLMVEKWPGQTADEKSAKLKMLEEVFDTRSWTKVENLNSRVLRAGLQKVREIIRPGSTAGVETYEQITPKPLKEAHAGLDKELISPEQQAQFREKAVSLGWSDIDLHSMLKSKEILSVDAIPHGRFDELLRILETGTEPVVAEDPKPEPDEKKKRKTKSVEAIDAVPV